MKHKVKIKWNYADRILTGEKTFEVRVNDRDYQKGDLLEFKVLGNIGQNLMDHKLNGALYEITYIHTDYGMDNKLDRQSDELIGFVILGIKPYEENNEGESEKWQ